MDCSFLTSTPSNLPFSNTTPPSSSSSSIGLPYGSASLVSAAQFFPFASPSSFASRVSTGSPLFGTASSFSSTPVSSPFEESLDSSASLSLNPRRGTENTNPPARRSSEKPHSPARSSAGINAPSLVVRLPQSWSAAAGLVRLHGWPPSRVTRHCLSF
ncbi:hypothetical protein NE237_009673 [Protea cynaroides]|uniref:Uncharacterized protein n=1 Tax=Protea cynaroides TaxID=273540 RepID=A0A9Q0KXW7_9MAGN|nr:hypothetical protein NE237_009673 [Protea cynaroides]